MISDVQSHNFVVLGGDHDANLNGSLSFELAVELFNAKTDFDVQGDGLVWYARPQLFFSCTLCPTAAKGDSCTHKEVSLVYFSTFEPIELTPDSVMQRA